MSKEYLESLNRLGAIRKFDGGDNYSLSDKKEFKTVKQALTELQQIKSAEPSKALECLERIVMPDELYLKECKKIGISNHYDYNTIKQALLKSQEQEKVLNEALKLNGEWAEELDYYKDLQEPKHYLKWEDLEFTRDEKVMIVKMGDTVYKILYRCCDGIEEVQLLSEDEKLLILNLIGKYKDTIQLFNDLRLERVEE